MLERESGSAADISLLFADGFKPTERILRYRGGRQQSDVHSGKDALQ